MRESALEQALDLFQANRRPARPRVESGYLDLLGERDATGAHPGQRLMATRSLPLVYQRLWRPIGGRLLLGGRLGTGDEHEKALAMLEIARGDRVLDVGCGPGNFTREFAGAAADGLVVGLDASETMLAVAAREAESPNLVYVRGDAADLPFRDGCFDAVCCFAALYLMEEPMRALDEIVRVLAPGGRVALLASCNRGPLPSEVTDAVVRRLTGIRVFGRDELADRLSDRGLSEVEQELSGFGQFLSGRKRRPSSN